MLSDFNSEARQVVHTDYRNGTQQSDLESGVESQKTTFNSRLQIPTLFMSHSQQRYASERPFVCCLLLVVNLVDAYDRAMSDKHA